MVRFLIFLLFSFSSFASSVSLEQLFDQQTNDYQAKNWGKVLARGHYYRHKYLRSEDEIKAAFSPNLYKLEVFALAEKCQWETVDLLLSDFKRFEKIKYQTETQTSQLIDKIKNFKAYKIVTKESIKSEEQKNQNSVLVSGIDWQSVSDLDGITIEVVDLCQK